MGPFVFLDTETTGFDPNRNRIIEVAAVKWQDGKILERWESLIDPRTPIPYEITLLTGITDEMVKAQPNFSEIQPRLAEFIEDFPIVGHNIAFDAGFLKTHHMELKNPEIDTVSLAKILLRKESSYALEVLMKKYGLPLRDSHRAMADTETAVSFFEFLLGKISEIPEPAWKTIEKILQKSEWPGKMVFQEKSMRTIQQETPKPTKNLSKKQKQRAGAERESPEFTAYADFLENGKILLESTRRIPFEILKKTPLLIAYASMRQRDELIAEAENTGLAVSGIKEPIFYCSPKKLREKLAQENFSSEETPFLIKMALWEEETKTGDREEISLEREEFGFFESLADNDGTDIYWQQALLRASKSDVIFIHQGGLGRGLGSHFPKRKLIIAEAARLEESFTNAFHKIITGAKLQPTYGEKATLAVGLMGIFYEHWVAPEAGSYKENVVLNDEMRNSQSWQRVIAAFENFPPHPQKNELLQALKPDENTVQWISFFADEIAYHSVLVNLAPIFRKSIASCESVLLQSPALSGDGSFGLARTLLELDSNWKEIIVKKETAEFRLDIQIAKDFPDPYASGYFKKCIQLFSQIMEQKHNRSLILLSSKKSVEAMYSALLPPAQKYGVKLLGVGASGGLGKSLALFLESKDPAMLLTTNQVLPRLQEIEDFLKVIVFQKIPFDHPDDPLLKARGKLFDNDFQNYTLPRAIMKFREILYELGRGKTQKTCYILDNRLTSRNYGQLFTLS